MTALTHTAWQQLADRLRPETRAFVGGEWRDAADGRTFATVAPANHKTLAEVAACGPPEVDAAVRAARAAFDDGRWSRLAPAERKRRLLRLADLIESDGDRLALLDSLDMGKPITDARTVDVPSAAACFFDGTPRRSTRSTARSLPRQR